MSSAPPTKRERLLFVSPVSPFNANSGAAQRSQLLLHALQHDHDVDVLELREAPARCIERQLVTPEFACSGSDMCHVIASVPPWRNPFRRFQPQPALLKPVEAGLGRPLAHYALVVGRYLWPISQLPLDPSMPTLVDLDDWRYRVQSGASQSPAHVLLRVRKALAHRLSCSAVGRFTAAFSVSDQDHRELNTLLSVTALPNVYPKAVADLGPIRPSARLLFVGAMWYPPNAEAMDWFLQRVWPRVYASRPDADLLIAGAGPEKQRKTWASHPGVTAPGFVSDLQAAYRDATLVLVPMLSGGGSNIKVLEAMAHRRPCVVSPLVAAAFANRLQADCHFLLGRTSVEFAQQTLNALDTPSALQPMADASWQVVHTHYSPQSFIQTARQTVFQILEKSRA